MLLRKIEPSTTTCCCGDDMIQELEVCLHTSDNMTQSSSSLPEQLPAQSIQVSVNTQRKIFTRAKIQQAITHRDYEPLVKWPSLTESASSLRPRECAQVKIQNEGVLQLKFPPN